MSADEARSVVNAGLERRKTEREQRDAELEKQARLLRITINDNHLIKTIKEAQLKMIQKEAAQKQYQDALEKQAEKNREYEENIARDIAVDTIAKRYGITALIILILSGVVHLNAFVSLALVAGLAVFPIVDIYRLYFPYKEVEK